MEKEIVYVELTIFDDQHSKEVPIYMDINSIQGYRGSMGTERCNSILYTRNPSLSCFYLFETCEDIKEKIKEVKREAREKQERELKPVFIKFERTDLDYQQLININKITYLVLENKKDYTTSIYTVENIKDYELGVGVYKTPDEILLMIEEACRGAGQVRQNEIKVVTREELIDL